MEPRRAIVCAALVFALLLIITTVSGASRYGALEADCGGVVRTGPLNWQRDYRAPLAIGDSTMLLALPDLAREGFSVNAHGCRQYPEALSLLSSLGHAGQLPRVVVIALGANGEITDGDIRQALAILGRQRLLVLVTPRELGGGSGSDARLVRAEARRHPNRVRLLDWVSYSANHPQWFEGDGLHLTPTGSAALARLIGRVRPLAPPPRSLPTPRCQAPVTATQMPLADLTLAPSGGVVRVRSGHMLVTIENPSSVSVTGLARVREAALHSPTIATSCVAVGSGGRLRLSLTLDRSARADLELRGRYSVKLELALAEATGISRILTSLYVLEA